MAHTATATTSCVALNCVGTGQAPPHPSTRKIKQLCRLTAARTSPQFNHASYHTYKALDKLERFRDEVEDHFHVVQTGTPFTGVCGWFGLSLALDIPDARVLMTDVQAMAEMHKDEMTFSSCAVALRHMEGTNRSLGRDGWMTGDCVTYVAEAHGVGVLTVRDHEQWYMATPTGGFHVTSLEEVKKIARPGSFQVTLGHDGGDADPRGSHWDVWLPASTPELPDTDMEVLGPHLNPDQ